MLFIFALVIRLQKTSLRRLRLGQYIRLGHTSSKRLQDTLKTSSSALQDVLPRRLQDIFKTSSKRLAKTSSRHLQDVLKTFWRHLQEVFKRYHQVKLFLLTSFWDVFNTFQRRTTKTVIYRKFCPSQTSEKLMVSVQNFQEW